MAEISNFDSARQTFARLGGGRGGGGGGGGRGFGGGGGRGFGGGGRGFGGGGGRGFGGGGGRGFGGAGRGFGGGGRGGHYHNWHGGHGWGGGYGYAYPYYTGLYSYPYYDTWSYLPVAVEDQSCKQGPASQQPVTFYNGHCVEDSIALERFASELNCCPGTVVRPMPGAPCESNGDVSQRMYHCAYN